jgi:UDP-glucose 4-epimerase
MKAIVFGGSGFLGSHVADALTERGYGVTIFDLKISAHLRPSQKMVVGSILDDKLVEKTIRGSDFVYNFAGIPDIVEAQDNPMECIKHNILGNAIILEGCRKAKIRRFVFASSLYVYSKAGSFYRSTKQSCELLIENYNEVYGLPYTILRYGSLYGPRADERNFIRTMIRQALMLKKIVREGDGEELREYIHVLDAANGSVDILSDEFANQSVIITGNQQMKVKDLLFMVREMLNNKIKIEFKPVKANSHYEITPYTFSPKTAKRIVNKSYHDLGQGILQCLQIMHQELAAATANGGRSGKHPKKKKIIAGAR